MAPQWEWNHNPDNSKWSLVKSPGYLRLYTANVTDSLTKAKNTLTQRILGFPANQNLSYGTVKINVSAMKEGDVAGLSVFQDPYAYIGVKVVGGKKYLTMLNAGAKTQQTATEALTDSIIYLRAVANYSTSKADFYYSTDNSTYTKFGSTLDMQYKLTIFVGNRFCIFNYATQAIGGYIDVDWFSTEKDFTEERFYDNSFTGYSEESLSLKELKTEKTNISLLTGSTKSLIITAVYKDGHTEDVTLSSIYENTNPDVVTVKNGQMLAKANGTSTITVTYQGGMGEAKSLVLNVNSTYFPLTKDLFNPSIYGTGSFNETTKTLITGQYGFGGWQYSSGVNLSAYKYLVVKLGAVASGGASLRVFDESSYWSNPAMVDAGSNRTVVMNMSNINKNTTTTKLNSSHIYIVGFWSYGGSPIVISEAYVTNNSDYSKPTGLDDVSIIPNDDDIVDVYTIMGIKVKSGVLRKDAISGLSNGFYIVGRQKVMVKN